MPRAILILLLSVSTSLIWCADNAEQTFRECLISSGQPPSLGHCIGVGAISKLKSLDNEPEFDFIDGVTFAKDQEDQEYKETNHQNYGDPADFRYLVDSLGQMIGHRKMLWDMGFLYPGLTMHVAPSLHPGGMLEFVLDPRKEILNKHSLKEVGTGRLLARQFLVPFLMGFKFNVTSLIPLLFGLLALLAKKAVIVSKIALVASSAFALASLLNANGNRLQYQQQQPQHHSSFNPGFGGYNRFPADEYQDVVYRGIAENNVDRLRLYDNLNNADDSDKLKNQDGGGRNFAWTPRDAQKK